MRRCREEEEAEEWFLGRAGGEGIQLPERIKHQVLSAAPLTIIKMPRLKGDIPNLRLFVSIKRVPQLVTHSRRCLTRPIH